MQHSLKYTMPKFEINTEYSDVLKSTLKDLGVKDSFAPGADFSKLSNDQLHLSILVQSHLRKTTLLRYNLVISSNNVFFSLL